MYKRFLTLAAVTALIALLLAGCGKSDESAVQLDPSNPVSLTVWHYYNGAQQTAFDELVSEFNATEGKEKGIYVEGYTQGSVGELEKAVTAAVRDEVGAQTMPDIFSTYADTAYAIQQEGKLADLSAYFTQDELADYVDSYIQEGHIGDDAALYLFPVAKSTEVLMVNKTDWDTFAQATGVTIDQLATSEGVVQAAKRYYEWTDSLTPDVPDDGKAFYGRDSMSNYLIIGMKQQGVDLFDVENGQVTIRADKDKLRRLWDNYYVPYVNGWFGSMGRFRSDDVKTGDLLAYTGSASSAMYFPDKVLTDNGEWSIDYMALPIPVLEGGDRVNVQQGASMAVTKSDPQHEYAACEFLKWFTAKENNLRFVCDSAYLPVRKDANSMEALDQVIRDNDLQVDQKAYDCLNSIFTHSDGVLFYTTKCFQNGYATREVLDYALSDKAAEDKAAIDRAVAAGTPRAQAAAQYTTDENFDRWYGQLCQDLEAAAHGG